MNLLNLQPSTLGLSAVVWALLLAITTYGLGRAAAVNARATRVWAATLLSMAAAFVCWSAGTAGRGWIDFLLGNALAVLCSVLFLNAIWILVGRSIPWGWSVGQFGAGVSGVGWVYFLGAPHGWAVVTIALAILATAMGSIVVLLQHRRIRSSVAGWTLIGVLLLVCVFFVASRLAVLVFGGGALAVRPLADHQVQVISLWLTHLIIGGASLGFLAVLMQQRRDATLARSRLDRVTGVLTQQAFAEQALAHLAHASVYSVLRLEVDHFQRLSEAHGREAGDAVLQQVATQLLRALRDPDVACRWSADSFCVLLPHCDETEVHGVASRICQSVASQDLTLPTPVGLAWTQAAPASVALSASVGVATAWVPSEVALVTRQALDALIRRADEALFLAQSMGRNQVQVVHTGAFDASWAEPLQAALPSPLGSTG